jgi:predicted nucleic acid-binding protein
MKLFLDSSAFAKRFIDERGSQEVEDLCGSATELYLSVLCVPETISALGRRLREDQFTPHDYALIKRRLSAEVRDAIIVNLTPEVVSAAIRVLETSPVRTMDALHIASAMVCDAELFATSDRRQRDAAISAGLNATSV